MTTHQDLLDESALALKQAYAPYSQLFVGAALRSANGKVYSGCNVESGAFNTGSCAERNAIAAAVRAEGAMFQLAAIAISATAVLPDPTSPCSSRSMRWSAAMSASISSRAWTWLRVSENGSAALSLARMRPLPRSRRPC